MNRRRMLISAIDLPSYTGYTATGTLAVSNGIASNFSASNYIVLPIALTPGTATWEMGAKFSVTSLSAMSCLFGRGQGTSYNSPPLINITTAGEITFTVSSNKTSWDISNAAKSAVGTIAINTDYWIKLYFTGSAYKVDLSTDGINYTNKITVASTSYICSTVNKPYFGINNGGIPLLGAINLNKSYIKINGKTYWRAV